MPAPDAVLPVAPLGAGVLVEDEDRSGAFGAAEGGQRLVDVLERNPRRDDVIEPQPILEVELD